MTNPILVLITHDLFDKFKELFLENTSGQVIWKRIDFSNRPPEFRQWLAEASVIVARTDLTDEEFNIAKNLKLIQLPIAGYDFMNLNRTKARGIFVANNGGANSISVADHTFLLILALNRFLIEHHSSVVDGTWVNKKHFNLELEGKKLGLIGFGRIGKQVAKRAKGFGLETSYFDIVRATPQVESDYNVTYKSREQILEESDIVSVHVPLTKKTRGMINAEFLGLMKPSALLINTARGEVQVEEALITALKNGKIRGAGLDVFQKEPLPISSPLTKMKNVVLTPHCGPSYETQYRVVELVKNNVIRIAKGLEPENCVINYDE